MKYKIEVSGRGGDSNIFKLTEEQREKLSDGDVESGNMGYEEICEILGVEDYFSSSDQIMGLYNGKNHGEHLYIEVYDESGEVIWKSSEDHDFEEVEESYEHNDGNYLLIEDYQKGLFFHYELELEPEFNPDLLSIKIVELLDGMSELITDVKYNGNTIDFKDYGDTSSKGYTYYLL